MKEKKYVHCLCNLHLMKTHVSSMKLNNHLVSQAEDNTYLEIHLDKRLIWQKTTLHPSI